MSLEHSPTKLAYGIAEAVQATNVGRSLLYEEIRAGKLKTFKVGKQRKKGGRFPGNTYKVIRRKPVRRPCNVVPDGDDTLLPQKRPTR